MYIQLSSLLKHRNCIMGFACLWIVLFHSEFNIPILLYIKEIGYGGVDIFFFVSGIGCYYSLSKDNNIYNFIKRRMLKVLPIYYTCLFFAIILESYFGVEITIQSIISNILCVRFFNSKGWCFVWYVTALWLSYFLAPYLKEIVDRVNTPISLLKVLLIIIMFTFSFFNNYRFMLMLTRIPIFFLGLYIGKLSKNEFMVNMKHIMLSLNIMIIGFIMLAVSYKYFPNYLTIYGLHWYPFILITPSLCLFLAILFEKVKLFKKLEIFGKYSFEIYLIHYEILSVINHLNVYGTNAIYNGIYCFIALLFTIPCCFLLRLFLERYIYNKINIHEHTK